MARHVNSAGLALVKSFEGLRLNAYRDVAGIWTIGYGHIKGVAEGDVITEPQAEQLLREDLAAAEGAVEDGTHGKPTTDNQFAAMVALCFNIGRGGFRESTVLRQHNAGKHAEAAEAFLMWNKARVNGRD